MLFLAVISLALPLITSLPTPGRDPRSYADRQLILDDIRYPPGFDIKAGLIGEQYRWPNRQLIYEIDPAFTPEERNVLHGAFHEIASKTCVSFRERTNQRDWVFIQRGAVNTGCWSYVGKIGGRQILNLQIPEYPGAGHCIWVGTAAHELIHAIGFHHEQCRYDRDDWVNIIWNNIPGNYHYAFEKYPNTMIDTFGVPYDYRSIMHYDAYAFAIDRSRPTIVPHEAGAHLGGNELTSYDVLKINRMYKCQ